MSWRSPMDENGKGYPASLKDAQVLAQRVLREGHPDREVEKVWADTLARAGISLANQAVLGEPVVVERVAAFLREYQF